MYRLIRYYNQNRKKILWIILIIVFIIAIIQILNFFAKKNNGSNNSKKESVVSNITYSNAVTSNKSSVTGSEISQDKLKKDTDIIDTFFNYCNEGDVEDAYELLTDECKEEMYPSVEDFKRIYYEYLFNGDKKSYTIENWVGDIYRIMITDDILSTGKLNSTETRQDYMTVIRKNNEYKLNINSYIGRKNLNLETMYNDIKVTVKEVNTYMDYEEYNIYVENNSNNTILLDTKDDVKSVYLLDSNDKKAYFFNNEVNTSKLVVQSKLKTTLKIKFSNSYSSTRKMKNIVFSKFVLNYDEYNKLENKAEYDFKELKIKL